MSRRFSKKARFKASRNKAKAKREKKKGTQASELKTYAVGSPEDDAFRSSR